MKGQEANLGQRASIWRVLIAAGSDPALKPEYLRMAALLSLLLAFGLRLYRLGYQSIWWDEGYSIDISSKSLSDIASTTAIHPPFYYWLLHFWLPLAGKSEFSARFLSLVFGVLIAALAYRLGLRLLGRNSAFLAAFLMAISPFLITYSQEARMYTLETLLGLASVYFLVELLLRQSLLQDKQRPPSGLLWGGYVLVTVLSLYVDYFPAAIMVFENLFVAAWVLLGLVRGRAGWSYAGVGAREMAISGGESERRLILRFALGWAFAQLAVVALYLPWLSVGNYRVRGYRSEVPLALLSLPRVVTQQWGALNMGVPFRHWSSELCAFTPYLGFAAAVLAAGLFLSPWRKPQAEERGRYWKEAFLLCYFLVPVVTFLVILRFRPLFHPRYMLFALPAYLLLLALALNAIWRWWRVLAMLSLGVICIGSGVAIHSYFFDKTFSKDDARSMAHFLAEEATEEDLILWEFNDNALEYYYRGVAPAREILPNLDTTAEELGRLAQGRRRVFWVTWNTKTLDPWGMVPFLLEKNGRKVGETAFVGYNVQWYELSPQWSFSLEDLKDTNMNSANKIALTGVAFGGEKDGPSLASGEAGWVVLRWRCLGKIEYNLKFYVHVYDKQMQLVGQDDRLLFNADGWQTPHWKEGDITYGFATPRMKPCTPPGDYSIEVGVYVAETLERLGIMQGSSSNTIGSFHVIPLLVPTAAGSLEIKCPLSAKFEEIELLGCEQGMSEVGQGDFLPMTLFWRAIQQPRRDLDAVVDLVDKGGAVVKEYRFPVNADYPTSRWQQGELFVSRYNLLVPADLVGGGWQLRINLAQYDSKVGEPVLLPPYTFRVTERRRSYAFPEAIQHPLKVEVGDVATLLGYSIDKDELRADDKLNLTLYWRAKATADKRYTVFAHLVDEGKHIWGQHDSMPREGEAPTTSWLEGEVIVDAYQIPVRSDCPAGEYQVEIGMYYLETGERLLVDGKDHLLLGTIEVLGLSKER